MNVSQRCFYLSAFKPSCRAILFRQDVQHRMLAHRKCKPILQTIGRRLQVTIAQPATEQLTEKSQRAVGKWLLACSGMAFGSIVLGGVTRLTKSGLSMVHWNPFAEFPPFGQQQWEQEFLKYQEYPEYKAFNQEMTLAEFKRIWHCVGLVQPGVLVWHLPSVNPAHACFCTDVSNRAEVRPRSPRVGVCHCHVGRNRGRLASRPRLQLLSQDG